jgi:hypothetical protein
LPVYADVAAQPLLQFECQPLNEFDARMALPSVCEFSSLEIMSRIIPALLLVALASFAVVVFLPWLAAEGELLDRQRFLWQIGFGAIGLGSLAGAIWVFVVLRQQ